MAQGSVLPDRLGLILFAIGLHELLLRRHILVVVGIEGVVGQLLELAEVDIAILLGIVGDSIEDRRVGLIDTRRFMRVLDWTRLRERS